MLRRALRTLAAPLALLAIEALWIAAATLALGTARAGGALPWPALFGAGALLYGWTRWLWTREVWENGVGRAAAGAGALVVTSGLMALAVGRLVGPMDWLRALGGLPTVLAGGAPLTVALAAGVALFWRVLLLARDEVTRWGAVRRIRLGAIVLLGAFLVVAVGRGDPFPLRYVLGFFAGALLALALGRAREQSALPGVSQVPVGARWLGSVGGAVAAVLALALLILALLPGQTMALLRRALAPLAQGVLFLYLLLAQLFAWLLSPLIEWLVAGMEPIPLPTPTPVPTPTDAERLPLEEVLAPPAAPNPLIPYLLIVGVVLLVLFWLGRLLRRRRAHPRAVSEPVTAYGMVEARGSFGDWLRRQRGALAGRFARPARARYGIETVRDLYRNLLLFGDAHGLPRPTEDTPYEYLEPLCARYPARCEDLRALTDAYVAVHYGERDFPDPEIERLRAAWQRIAAQQVDVPARRVREQG